ncbi:NlpC/P60 family protein [Paenibacillus sp. P26]|nr:NlpC/P60 family protein [Paenibacillus sp. P26]UUZ91404.1 NlpC/P60 family protein [Paenibacillus sp. P25]
MIVSGSSDRTEALVYPQSSGQVWVPLEETSQLLNFNLHREGDSFSLGATDPVYRIRMNDTAALDGDRSKRLPQAPEYRDGKPYMTVQALSALIGTPIRWDTAKREVTIDRLDDAALAQKQAAPKSIRSLALGPDQRDEIVRFAQSLEGTPYQFSAADYNASHVFDCSSFTQYVFGHFGVSLPRASRDQGQVGRNVPMDQLQPGDLMFFYTPGRYESNRIIGHVAIYAGGGRMVHTYGSPGVTMSDFSDYWKNRFLFAKSVL